VRGIIGEMSRAVQHQTRPVQRQARRTQRERVEDSARRLLDATVELINEQGFEQTTAAEIGERAGLSYAMVRVRFGSREALLDRLLREKFAVHLLPPPGELVGLDLLKDWVEHMLAQIAADDAVLRALLVLICEGATPKSSLRGWSKEWIATCQAVPERALADGQRIGCVRPDVDPAVEAEFFMSCVAGCGFRFGVDGDAAEYGRILQTVLARLIAAVAV
jgi:AcrR family transcriptional regulator